MSGSTGRRAHSSITYRPTTPEWYAVPQADEQARVVVVDDDEGVVPFELAVRGRDGLGQIALVVPLHEVDDDLGVGLGAEDVAVGDERLLQLAEVLHDPVQDDGEAARLAARQRVRVLLGDAPVRGPARVAEPGGRDRAVPARRLLQEAEVADGADVVEAGVLAEHDSRRVVAAVLGALVPVQKERLAGSRPHVSDDSAHLNPPFVEKPSSPSKRIEPGLPAAPPSGRRQPSSRRTRAPILAESSSASACVSASASMRISDSMT